MQTRQLNTLDAGIRASLAKLGDAAAAHYFRLLPHAYDFWKDYVADTGRENRTVELAILPDRTAVLPDDYTEYVMVGIRTGQYVQNLVYNGKLASMPANYEQFLTGPVEEAIAADTADGLRHDYLGYAGGELRGYGYPGFNGEFRIDAKQRRIICSTQIPGDGVLLLQYYALSPSTNDGWVISPLWDKALHLYLSWQFYLYVKKDLTQAREFERLYLREKKKTERRASPFSLAGAAAAIGDAARSFPK